MVARSGSKQNKELARQVEFSAISWVVSLVLHILIVCGLMYATFTNIQSTGQSQAESFTVELGDVSGSEVSVPELVEVESISNVQLVVDTVAPTTEIILSEVDISQEPISTQQSDLIESVSLSPEFNESLAGSDTGGSAGFFGLSAEGTGFVYIIDCSGSMSGEKFTAALNELNRSVRALDIDKSFYLIFYNDRYIPMQAENLVDASTANKSKYLAWAYTVNVDGGTDPLEAIFHAFSLKPDAIWLLTDGVFVSDRVEAITQANKTKIPIHTLAFGSEADVQQLQAIARNNKGKFRTVYLTR